MDTLAAPALSWPDRTTLVRRATARLCLQLGWSPVHEVPLPNGRRADILALRGDGGFVCIEVKSGARDFQTDAKWPEYRDFADALYFAVDTEFPVAMLPGDVGLIVACGREAEVVREAPAHALAAARRRMMMQRFAMLAAARLARFEDPAVVADLRAALRVE